MPPAIVFNAAGKANTTGGTFADTLTANSGDSLSVANYNTGGAKILEAWVMDSASVAEFQIIYTRPQSTHDQQHGLRFQCPSLLPGGAGKPGAHSVLPGLATVDLYKSDTAIVQVTSTAADNVLYGWQTLYDDLPGVSGVFVSWPQVQSLQVSAVGIQQSPVAGTAPAYGTARAFNADDDRLHANTWYAILGATARTSAFAVTLLGPDWGGQRIGLPLGVAALESSTYFLDQWFKWQLPLIPCFNSNNRANIFAQVADCVNATSPILDWFLYELSGTPVAFQ
jgi:hypothetical protein